MQKLILFLCVCSLPLGKASICTAHDNQSSQSLSKDDIRANPGDTALKSNIRKDSTVIDLSPVVLTANSNPSSTEGYNNLSPLTPISTAGFVTGNLNDYLLGFIKNYYEDNGGFLQSAQAKGKTYFNIIDKVLNQFGIPEQLRYLAVIESGLNTRARSQAGAVGAWQLMAGTARLLGLEVNRHRDDRQDLYKSTLAAAKYLTNLHNQFDNWLLVVAAYNCGPGGVLKAIDESGSTDFWDLKQYLPQESQRHVMKFLATAYILDRFASFFGVDKSGLFGSNFSTSLETTPSFAATPVASFQISGKYSLPVMAKFLSMSIPELNSLNPGFDKLLSGGVGSYDLRLPPDKMIIFKEKRNAILNESVDLLMDNNRQVADAAYPAAKPLPVAKKKHHVHKG